MAVFGALLVTVLLLFVYWCYDIFRKNRMTQKIPGPLPIPVFGTRFPKNYLDLPILNKELFEKYGDTVKFFIGGHLQVITRDTELIEEILKSNTILHRSYVYQLASEFLMDGLIVSHGKKWRTRRKFITPSFHFAMLGDFFPTFIKNAEVLIEKLRPVADEGKRIDVMDYVSKFALDVIGETSFGMDLKIQEGTSIEYINSINDFTSILFDRTFSLWKRFDFLFKLFGSDYDKKQKAIDTINTTGLNVIQKRRKEISNEYKDEQKVTEENHRPRVNLIRLLLNQSNNLTDTDIQEEVNNFLFAGFDTTSTGISLCLYELSKRSEIQNKIFNEISEFIGTDHGNLTIDKINTLKYLDMVVKETFRFKAPLPFIGRRLVEDTKLGGVLYPAGTDISIDIFLTHRNPKYYRDPEVFDPERFHPDNPDKPPTFAFIPFSAGPRNCIGQKYAMLEMKTALIRILMDYEIVAVEDNEMILGYSAILRPKDGYPMKLVRRKKTQ